MTKKKGARALAIRAMDGIQADATSLLNATALDDLVKRIRMLRIQLEAMHERIRKSEVDR